MGVKDAVRRRLARLSGVDALRSVADRLRTVADAQADEIDRLRNELATTAKEQADALAELGHVIEAQRRAIDELHRLHGVTDHLTRWLEDHGRALDGLGARATALEPLLAAADHTNDWLTGHATAIDGVHVRVGKLELAHAVEVFIQWLDRVEVAATPLISVVLPTRNRAALLPRAVASLLAQDYPNWELVIVDDASEDDTPAVIAGFTDPRIRSLRGTATGVCAARNLALDAATGEIVTYLDDDNTMHPLWLKALAWAFGTRPEVDTVYGGFVIDDMERVDKAAAGGSLPQLVLRPYSREVLLAENLADIGAVAHRAGLSAARFDESLTEMGDWDLLCGLTADRDPLVLPTIACFYSTDAPGRLSNGPTYAADLAAIRRKHAPS